MNVWQKYRTRYMKLVGDGDGGGGGGAVTSPSPSDSGAGATPTGGDSGGSVTPSSPDGGGSPQTPPSTPSTPDSGEAADPWAALGQTDFDQIDIPVNPEAQVPTTPQATPPAPAQTTPPQQPQTQPQQPAVQPQAPTQPTPAQEPQVELSPSDPIGIAAAVEANRGAVEAHLASTRFALTPEEVQELDTDAVSFIPKMMAKVYTEAMIASQRFLAQAVPGMIHRHQQVTSANSEAENKFFAAHEALGLDKNNLQHRQAAVRLAKIYRQMNPQMPLEQLISDIGPMVAKAVGAQPRAPGAQPTAVPVQPGTVMRGGVPFRPAVNGGGGAAPQPAADDNPWGGLGLDFDQ